MNKKVLIGFALLFILGIILIFVGNRSVEEEIVIDNTKYYISLVGDKEMSIYKGDKYVEPGFNASSSKGDNLTSEVSTEGEVDVNRLGEYEIKYILNDTVETRIVKVVEKPIGYTYIHLFGERVIYLNVGESYNEPGYFMVDSLDGTVSKDNVTVVNKLDNKKAGVYYITYSAVNSSGITTSEVRTIVVMDSEISLTSDSNGYTNKEVNISIYVNDAYFDYIVLPNQEKVNKNSYVYKVSANGSYKFVVYNKKGGYKEATININNINKTLPTGSCNGSYQEGKSTINVSASDDIGIGKYVINNKTYTSSPIVVSGELKNVSVAIYDKAGNTSTISCNLEDKNVYGDLNNINTAPSKQKKNNVTINYYKSSSGKAFTYYAYIPDNVKPGMPIISFIGGLGEMGNDYYTGYSSAVAVGPIHEVLKWNQKYDAIILHLQVPEDGGYVYACASGFMELINKVADEYRADKNRLSIMGFSHGCYGVFDITNKYPNYFAAAVPIGCTPFGKPENFRDTAYWAFVGAGDGVETLYYFALKVQKVNGGRAYYNQVDVRQHNILTNDYSVLRDTKYNVMDWLIKTSK